MRITHNMMTRNYLGSLNKNLKNLAGSNAKLSSQRSFNRVSENIADADRTLRTRKLLDDNDRSLSTIDTISGTYTAAEDGMMAVNKILNTVTDLVMKGTNGTYSDVDRKTIANEIDNLQNQAYQIMNSKFSDKFLYGASGNKAGSAPFTIDTNGALLYHGQNVDSMKTGANNEIQLADGTPISFNSPNYIDIGLGFALDANGNVDPRTAVKSTFSGVETFGYGTSADGLPNNIFSLLGKMSKDIASGDIEAANEDFTHMQKQQENLLVSIADVGSLTSYVDSTKERLDTEKLTLQTVQNGLEAVDLSEEIMYNKDFEMSWMVTLQLGSKVIPQSIFDFIR